MTIRANLEDRIRDLRWPSEGRARLMAWNDDGYRYREAFVVIETGEIVWPGDTRWRW